LPSPRTLHLSRELEVLESELHQELHLAAFGALRRGLKVAARMIEQLRVIARGAIRRLYQHGAIAHGRSPISVSSRRTALTHPAADHSAIAMKASSAQSKSRLATKLFPHRLNAAPIKSSCDMKASTARMVGTENGL
jgi:hypothetical protein